MKYDVETRILELNFLEFLTTFLEGKVNLPMVLAVNERIYDRDPATLSESLLKVTGTLHEIKKRIDLGETIDHDSMLNIVNDCVLLLIDENSQNAR